MCNIAGYVGSRPAAPVLIDMIKAQEGFNAGFYTGIATMHEGKIYYAKLSGDTDRLLSMTEAAKLPGNIGIIHSRTRSGGGDGWAHPFVSYKNEKVDTAYVANGSAGIFKTRIGEAAMIAKDLENDGYLLNCKLWGVKNPSYPVLDDGACLHMSDIMCQLFQRNMDKCQDAVEAVSRAYCQFPGEIVGLLLNLSVPNAIVWSRISKPMFVGFSAHGACLSSCAIAFPKDFGEPRLLPACSAGCVYADHYTEAAYKDPPARVAEIDDNIYKSASEVIIGALSEGEKRFSDLLKLVRPLDQWQKDADCLPDTPLVYDILYKLYKEQKLKMHNVSVEGVQKDILAPLTLFSL